MPEYLVRSNAHNPMSGRLWFKGHNGQLLSDNLVDERGFACKMPCQTDCGSPELQQTVGQKPKGHKSYQERVFTYGGLQKG
jgi:phosphodiesterase/alkaline phosphatase D-like protein